MSVPATEAVELRYLVVENNQVVGLSNANSVTLTFWPEGDPTNTTVFTLASDPEVQLETVSMGNFTGEGAVFGAVPDEAGLSAGQWVFEWSTGDKLDDQTRGRLEITPTETYRSRLIFEKVQKRIGELAKRRQDPVVTPTDDDYELLNEFLEDALHDVSTQTDRVEDTVQRSLSPGQTQLRYPPELDTIDLAIVDNGTKAVEVDVINGPDVAAKARSPKAERGLPCEIGQLGNDLWFYPEPTEELAVDLYGTLSGEAPSDGTLDDVMALVPDALNRALVNYVARDWLVIHEYSSLAQIAQRRYQREVDKHRHKSNTQTTASRPYNVI